MLIRRLAEAVRAEQSALDALRALRDEIEEAYPVTVLPARVNEQRWASLPEIPVSRPIPFALAERLPLGGEWGLVLYGWGELPEAAHAAIRERCRRFSPGG
jgi:hypothetical protein